MSKRVFFQSTSKLNVREVWDRIDESGVSYWDHTKTAAQAKVGDTVYVGPNKSARDSSPADEPTGIVGILKGTEVLANPEDWTDTNADYVIRHYITDVRPVANREVISLLEGVKVSMSGISYLRKAA